MSADEGMMRRRNYIMNTLKSLVENVTKNDHWRYNSGLKIKYLEGKEFDFIKGYLEFSGKEDLYKDFSKLTQNEDGRVRLQHIVNAFFLGIALYNESLIMKSLIDNELNKYKYALDPFHKDAPFAYVWFLICFFHDCGYAYEKNLSERQFHCFEELTGKYGNLGRIEGVPALYENVLRHYFRYRMDGNGRNVGKGVNDHGIVGAHEMYHHFCQIRAEKRKEAEGKNETNKWVKGLDDVYNLAAWIVACHNIFFANASDKCDICRFSSYHLYPLMKEDDDYKILMAEYPLFFFLHLIDNIEPMKIPGFKEDYLSQINTEVDDNMQYIEMSICKMKENENQIKFVEKYAGRLCSLTTWLTETEKKDDPEKITVIIHFAPKHCQN